VTPPPLDRWIDVVLMLCVSLAQGVATTLGRILSRTSRDWHTAAAHEDLPQARSGNQSQGARTANGIILRLVPSPPLGASRGARIDPFEIQTHRPVIPDARAATGFSPALKRVGNDTDLELKAARH